MTLEELVSDTSGLHLNGGQTPSTAEFFLNVVRDDNNSILHSGVGEDYDAALKHLEQEVEANT